MPPMGDREDVARLVYAYAERLDRGDLDGVAELFRHATWRTSRRADVLQGVEQVRHAYDNVILYDGLPGTLHMITNLVVVTAAGAGVASSRCSFTVLQARPDVPPQPILAGRYLDEFERHDGGWRFTDRLIAPELFGDLSRHMRP
jgi:3-phenylpropionate/cinnamic acid dioxygenase small subunit